MFNNDTNNFIEILAKVGRFCRFTWGVLINPLVSHKSARPSIARAQTLNQMYEIGIKSVPVVMVTGAFVAMTLAVQSYAQLKEMGLQDRLGSLINISVVKELGPVLTAFMLAGRVGGALTAELGTMRVTEQIDAIQAMGADPIRYLVWPRFLACVLLIPFLTIYADLMGVLGGYAISVWHFGINSEAYWRFSSAIVEKWDISIGIFKSVFFGASIALISCHKGFSCTHGARGVGKACTEAFVFSFIAILTLNFILAIIFKAIYMTLWNVQSYI
ncbi:MAG: ABC transporter permease [Phycisphaerae bacterium]|nr:ABC transporter permease [Phycisphaerae bacterium]